MNIISITRHQWVTMHCTTGEGSKSSGSEFREILPIGGRMCWIETVCLVGGPGPPLWKIWKSIGMMKFPIYGKIKHVPNHQPVCVTIPLWRSEFRTSLFQHARGVTGSICGNHGPTKIDWYPVAVFLSSKLGFNRVSSMENMAGCEACYFIV